MYSYTSYTFIKKNRWICDQIGCFCKGMGILATNLFISPCQTVPYSLMTDRFQFRAICVTCHRQGLVWASREDLPNSDPDELYAVFAKVEDYMIQEKGCRHADFWTVSRSIRDSEDQRLPGGSRNPDAPRLHLVCCVKCRRRGIMQFSKRMSDMMNGKEV